MINKESNNDKNMIIVGKPASVQKVLHVSFDADKGLYSGLPTIWRELLEMPLDVSRNEVDSEKLDSELTGIKPNNRIKFFI